MFRRLALALLCFGLLTTIGCAGIRESGNHFTIHAESFRILGFSIPEDDQAAALRHVPQGATIHTQLSTPADWTSIVGILKNIMGFHGTMISGSK